MPFERISSGLAARLRWLVALAIAGFGLLAAITLHFDVGAIEGERQDATRHIVESAHSIVARFHKEAESGRMTTAEAQGRALDALRGIRYGNDDYVFVSDMQVRSVMHPIKPELDGKDLSNLKDPNGVALFAEFARTVRAKGAGFVPYAWPKPGHTAPVAKLSYVKGFEPWGWIVGSGIYLDDMHAATRMAILRTVGAFCVVAILTIVGATLLARRILQPIRDAVSVARKVAAGDLTGTIDIRSQDETGQLAQALREMNESLRDLVGHVQGSVAALETEARNLDRTSQSVQSGAEGQRASVASVVAAIGEVSDSAQSVVSTAEQVRNLAQESLTRSRQGVEQGTELSAQISALRDTVSNVGTLVLRFVESSQSISGMTRQVRDIADQTNLLALNAAIEAARAGEQGRGFAVVADEVRKLAEKSALAARQIDDVTARLEEESRAVDTGIRSGVAALDDSQVQVRSVAEVLRGACDAAVQAAEGVEQIANVIGNQRHAIDAISSHANELASSADRAMASVEDSTETSARLGAMAGDLRHSVEKFRLG